MKNAQKNDRRSRQSAQTRSEVLDVARRLFATNGYRATTVAQVAEAAGVSVQTIYDSIGSKAALVSELNNVIDENAGIAELVRAMATETDPATVLGLGATVARRIIETSGDTARALVSGAEIEPELRVVLDEGMRRHREGSAFIADRLDALGALAPGTSAADAADTISVHTEIAVWLLLLDSYGWDLDRAEAWTNATLTALVLV